MEEDSYRQSRLCRLLGNPVVFAVVELLAENKELNPSEIARAAQKIERPINAAQLVDDRLLDEVVRETGIKR